MRNLRSAAVIVAVLIWAGQVSEAQTVTIFGNALPSTPVDSDTNAVTLGVKFSSTQAGTIAGIRFYRGHKASSNGYTVKLFSNSGSLLASARTTKDTCTVPCWEQVNFASAISLAANTTYTAGYYTTNGQYADDQYYLVNSVTSGPLTVPANGGVYTYSTGFPNQTWNASNYYVDVSFTPNGAPPPQTPVAVSFSPAGPVNVSDNSPAGTVISGVQVSTSDGKAFAGTVAIIAQSIAGMVSLSSAALPSNVQVASVNANDVGSQTVSIQACENGTCTSSTLSMNVTANQSGATITGLSLSNTKFAGGAADGTVVGTITATTSDGSTPTLSLIGVQTGSGNDASSFRISSKQLLTNTGSGTTDQPGQYNICIVAIGNYSNSPQQICPTIQATGPGGTGWQLTFSDEFNDNGGMVERLSLVSASSYTWANSVCPGMGSGAQPGCGTLTVPSLPTGISSAGCTGSQLGACDISIEGATCSDGCSDANGVFMVAAVPNSTTINIYQPAGAYPNIDATMSGAITVGSGPWTGALINGNGSSWAFAAQNDNGDTESFDPHACVESGGNLLLNMRTTNVFVPPSSMLIAGTGAPTSSTCMVQSWPGQQQGFAFGQPEELYIDYNAQFPTSGDEALWALSASNNWPPEADLPECFGGGNGNCDVRAYPSGMSVGSPRPGTTSFVQFGADISSSTITFYQAGIQQGPPQTNGAPGTTWYPIITISADPSGGPISAGTMYVDYVRVYKKVTSGACYSSIPAPGTIPHTGTC